ncbi:metallophosphoesterase [Sorangium sp. So ce185]|uniref:metallophosphoesterase family protein n=1 Tax=Sorangium sp. So ce185 TaxID=3133287 RepID=UPI003F618743
MKSADPVTILHISDTQFGRNHVFGRSGILPTDKAADALAERIISDLDTLRRSPGLSPDIIILTGDISEWGNPTEFQLATAFINRIMSALHLQQRHVVLVPGNHDVNRAACHAYFLKCQSMESSPVGPYWPKLENYAQFHNQFYEGFRAAQISEEQSWALFEIPELRVAIAALNSDMAESHLEEDHYGWLGEKQLIWAADRMRSYEAKQWLRIAAVHHNVHRGAQSDDENMRDADALQRILAPHLNILFHGHTHNGGRISYIGSTAVVSTGSAGVIKEARPEEVPNQYQIVRIYPTHIEQYARMYVPTQSRWMGDNRISPDGNNWRHRETYTAKSTSDTFSKHRIKNIQVPKKKPASTLRGRQSQVPSSRAVKSLTVLRQFVSTGTAEGEGTFLKDAFVTPRDYLEIITPPASSPRILVGKKGSGKSAFINYLLERLAPAKIPALLLRPDDLQLDEQHQVETVAQLKSRAYSKLLRAISFNAWARLPGIITPEDEIFLREIERHHQLSEFQLARLSRLVANLGASADNVDTHAALKGALNEDSTGQFDVLLSSSRNVFYLLLDDTDQLAAVATPGHLNRIWGFLLAVRKLTSECSNVKCIVSIRSEIWRRLEVDPLGQRDQTDHFRLLVHYLNPSKTHIQNILEKRLELASRRIRRVDGSSLYAPFFDGHSVTIPTTNDTSSWKEFFLVRSRGRPRDVIQLVSHVTRIAIECDAPKVNSDHVATGMLEFSRGRVSDIAAEIGEECPQFFQVVQSLWRVPFKANIEDVREHLQRLPSTMRIQVRGTILRPGELEDAIRLWGLLYESGVLNARIADARQREGYRHIDPLEDPNLVCQERWNEMQSVIWEINPAYRDFLLQTKRAEENRDGLPPTS